MWLSKHTKAVSDKMWPEDHISPTPGKRHWTQALTWILLNSSKLNWWAALSYVQVLKSSTRTSGLKPELEIKPSKSVLLSQSPTVTGIQPPLSISMATSTLYCLLPQSIPHRDIHCCIQTRSDPVFTLTWYSPPLKPFNGSKNKTQIS